MATASLPLKFEEKMISYHELIGGAVLFLIAFVEWRYFKFYPLEAGIFIDVSGRSKEDLQLFNQLQNYITTQSDGSHTVYEVFY